MNNFLFFWITFKTSKTHISLTYFLRLELFALTQSIFLPIFISPNQKKLYQNSKSIARNGIFLKNPKLYTANDHFSTLTRQDSY